MLRSTRRVADADLMTEGDRLGGESAVTRRNQYAKREARPSEVRCEGNDDDRAEEVVERVGLRNQNRARARYSAMSSSARALSSSASPL